MKNFDGEELIKQKRKDLCALNALLTSLGLTLDNGEKNYGDNRHWRSLEYRLSIFKLNSGFVCGVTDRHIYGKVVKIKLINCT